MSITIFVGAIVAVGSLSEDFTLALKTQGREILGGDVTLSLPQEPATPAEQDWMNSHAAIESTASLHAMAQTSSSSPVLINLLAVGRHWPELGTVETNPEGKLDELLASQNGYYGLVAAPELRKRLGLPLNSKIEIGSETFVLRSDLISQPQALLNGFALGPQVIISKAALKQTNLLKPGALVTWTYHILLNHQADKPASHAAIGKFLDEVKSTFPHAGWRISERDNATPQISNGLKQLFTFLNLVAAVTLMIGGVGAESALRAHMRKRRPQFAILRTLGASGPDIFLVNFFQLVVVTLCGILLGVALGVAVPYVLFFFMRNSINLELWPRLYIRPALTGAYFGLLTAFTFTILPLGKMHDFSVAAQLRPQSDTQIKRLRPEYVFCLLISAGLLTVSAFLFFLNSVILIAFLGLVGSVAALRYLTNLLQPLLFRGARKIRPLVLRKAVANLGRPNSTTPAIVVSIAIACAGLVSITQVQENLRHGLDAGQSATKPSLFFLDIPATQSKAFRNFIESRAPSAILTQTPMLRGRISQLNGVPIDKARYDAKAARLLRGDRGLTYSTKPPLDAHLTSGHWWPRDYTGPPLVSLDDGVARELHLDVGDTITVNVLGRDITARIANLRHIDWASMHINFILLFSPYPLKEAPHSLVASIAFPKEQTHDPSLPLMTAVSKSYPMVSIIRLKDVIAELLAVIDKVGLAILLSSSVAAIAGALSLSAAIMNHQAQRLYEATILMTLGAVRRQILSIAAFEYIMVGFTGVLYGSLLGGLGAFLIMNQIFREYSFHWYWGASFKISMGAILCSVLFGLGLTWFTLGQKEAANNLRCG